MSVFIITPGDPRDPAATALLRASHALMQSLFDPEDNHYLEIEDLCVPSIKFLVARNGTETLGCAALSNQQSYGEIKSMFVAPAARGQGVADALMTALDKEARQLGLTTLKLETGDKLKAAHRLYHRHGFRVCGPFGAYEESPASVFMSKPLG